MKDRLKDQDGMSAVLGLLMIVAIILGVAIVGGILAKIFLDKPAPPTAAIPPPKAIKLDRALRIAELEKKVRAIPGDRLEENLAGYRQLLVLDPNNPRYKRRAQYYLAQIQAMKSVKKKVAYRTYVKIADPPPQVFDSPIEGQALGRAVAGQMVEVLETRKIAKGSVDITWYRIHYKDDEGWINQLGVFGPPITKPIETSAELAAKQRQRLKKIADELIDDYDGKVVSVETLTPDRCWVQVNSSLSFEQARQVSENIGYYIHNSTGAFPEVRVFVGNLQVAVAKPVTRKYVGKLEVKKR